MFEHNVPYKYERNHWWNGINYRPDFTIFKSAEKGKEAGVVIEYFGMEGDSDYDEMSGNKREYWGKKTGWDLLEFTPIDISSNGKSAFLDIFKSKLVAHGISCNRLTEDEIWNKVHHRAIDRFTNALRGFIGRCRKQSISPAELKYKINSYEPVSLVEARFLNVAHLLYAAYLQRLLAAGEDDFDGLMQRAAEEVGGGKAVFQQRSGCGDLSSLRYLCVDEFQDFSNLFYGLLVAIMKVAPNVQLFCVGDDWQAINGFAGSDLKFFENFDGYFENSKRLYISTNYRSRRSIVDIGNNLMSGKGKPASFSRQEQGRVLVADLGEFNPSLIEQKRHAGDVITPAVLRIAGDALAKGMDVVLLCRRNALPYFVNFQDRDSEGNGLARYIDLVRSFFPRDLKERITISTAHKYKGLDKSMVIVLDLVARSYPLIHPDWAFSRILGDSLPKIVEEERRLLYVALTRAKDELIIVTERGGKSPFLEELQQQMSLEAINWDVHSPVRTGLATSLVVMVGNQDFRGGEPTFAIKDLLKASGYQWRTTGRKGWAKTFLINGFSVDILKSEVWASQADGVDVQIVDESNDLIACYLIDDGNWRCVSDDLASLVQEVDSVSADI